MMSRRTPANLSQIARHLGLSVTTVSRALKDGPEVHPETRTRVQAAAAEFGYVPNLAGRALRTGRTGNLTAILPLETQGSLSDIAKLPLIEGMTVAAQRAGYALSVASTTPEEDARSGLLRVLNAGATPLPLEVNVLDWPPGRYAFHMTSSAASGAHRLPFTL